MDVLLITVALGAAGHFLNKDGKAGRPQAVKEAVVASNDKPDGALIYESNRKSKIDQDTLLRGVAKQEKRMQYMFPLDHDKPQTVRPSVEGEPSGNVAPFDYSGGVDDSQAARFQAQRATLLQKNDTTVTPIDPSTGQPTIKKEEDVFGGPMFRSFAFKGPVIEEFASVGAPVSSLAGIPMDPVHNNMQPNFKGSNRREGLSEAGLTRLENFTGMSAGVTSYDIKQERPAVWNGPQDIKPVELSGMGSNLYDRAQFAMADNSVNAYVSPIHQYKDTPMDMNAVRIAPKTLEERDPNNAKRVIESGQMPQSRVVQGLRASIPQTIRKFDPLSVHAQQSLPSRGAITQQSMVPRPSVRENKLTTMNVETSYMGPAVSQNRGYGRDQMYDAYDARMDDAVFKKNETFTPRLGVPSGNGGAKAPAATGVYMMNETEKGKLQTYIQPGFDGRGQRNQNVDAPDVTLKDMLDVSGHSGKINRTDRTTGAYTEIDMDAPMTHKAMNSEVNYITPGLRDRGQGIRQHGVLDWTTAKEMLTDGTRAGAPKSLVPAHMSYEGIFEHFTDRTMESGYVGPATSQVKARKYDDTEIIDGLDDTKLEVENYISNPNRLSTKTQDQDEFRDAQTKPVDKLEFGGRMGIGRSTISKESYRDAVATVYDGIEAEGRLPEEVPVSGDVAGVLPVHVAVRDDAVVAPTLGNAKVRTQHTMNEYQPGISVRTANNEALNDRLDPGVRITNDLFPYA